MNIRILLLNKISNVAKKIFEKEDYYVEEINQLSHEELKEKIKDFHIIGIRSKTTITSDILKCAKNLMAIGHFCIGTDQTDLISATSRGIPIFNSPYENTRSVAEIVVSFIIMLSRKIGDRNNEMHNSIWNKTSKNCNEIRGKTLGIIGYGSIGTQLSHLAEALGLNVMFYDIVTKLRYNNSRFVSFDYLIENSDFISLHVPLTTLTTNMINKDVISNMKKGSYLINTSRGPVVNVEDVATYLNNGHLGGAAFDVFPIEPKINNKEFYTPLQKCNNVIMTPHIAGSTEEAQLNIGNDVALKLINYIKYGISYGSVNFPQIEYPPAYKQPRIINIHRNEPGVLSGINNILKDYNITNQILSTYKDIGLIIIEIEFNDHNHEDNDILEKFNQLEYTISTRLV